MDQNRPDSRSFGNAECSYQGIVQKADSSPFAVKDPIHRESSEYDHRNRIRHIPFHRSRRVSMGDGPGGEGIIADHSGAHANHISSRCSIHLIAKRTTA